MQQCNLNLTPRTVDACTTFQRFPLREAGGPAVATLIRVVLQCYYRDDRVLRSLGLELRPPFPKGYTLEQGDWSLLDPVKARAPMWRRTS
jgi:hypothetical protein